MVSNECIKAVHQAVELAYGDTGEPVTVDSIMSVGKRYNLAPGLPVFFDRSKTQEALDILEESSLVGSEGYGHRKRYFAYSGADVSATLGRLDAYRESYSM